MLYEGQALNSWNTVIKAVAESVPQPTANRRQEDPGTRYLVDSAGLHPLNLKIEAVVSFRPNFQSSTTALSNDANSYRRFAAHRFDIILPLTDYLSGSKRSFEMSAFTLAASGQAKTALTDSTLLTYFAADAPIFLMADASNVSVGAVFQQHPAEQRRVGWSCDENVSVLQLQGLLLTTGNGTIPSGVSAVSQHPFVPPPLRRNFFSSLHNLPQPGSRLRTGQFPIASSGLGCTRNWKLGHRRVLTFSGVRPNDTTRFS
nr:unnamed protein product [Spirometra erinaceieuropaei]